MNGILASNDVSTLITAVVARLQGRIANLAIEPFDDAKAYRLTHQRGALLVGYTGADYDVFDTDRERGGSATVDVVGRQRTMRVSVVVKSRQLVGLDGAYVMLEAVRLALTGFQPLGFTRFAPERDRFLEQSDGVWTYVIVCHTSTYVTEPDDANGDEDGPANTRLTIAGPDLTSEIAPA